MANVLIAGGAGFIGSHLAKKYIDNGDQVTVIDNLVTGSIQNLVNVSSNPAFKFIQQDLSTSLRTLNEEFDFVFHMASPASPPKYLANALETMEVNSIGTLNLLNYVEKNGGRLLFASTSEIYGDPLVHPQAEDYWGNVNPIGPRSVYDEAKRMGETYISYFQRERNSNSVIVRIFNTFGPNMDPWDGRVVSTFIRNCLSGEPMVVFGDGLQTRSFCYVDDLVDGLRRAMHSNITGPINLGNPEERTLIDLGNHVASTLGLKPEFRFDALPIDDPKQRRPDIRKAQQELGWEPKVSIDDGIAQTAEWMRSQI